jgi:hypothetical protein
MIVAVGICDVVIPEVDQEWSMTMNVGLCPHGGGGGRGRVSAGVDAVVAYAVGFDEGDA